MLWQPGRNPAGSVVASWFADTPRPARPAACYPLPAPPAIPGTTPLSNRVITKSITRRCLGAWHLWARGRDWGVGVEVPRRIVIVTRRRDVVVGAPVVRREADRSVADPAAARGASHIAVAIIIVRLGPKRIQTQVFGYGA